MSVAGTSTWSAAPRAERRARPGSPRAAETLTFTIGRPAPPARVLGRAGSGAAVSGRAEAIVCDPRRLARRAEGELMPTPSHPQAWPDVFQELRSLLQGPVGMVGDDREPRCRQPQRLPREPGKDPGEADDPDVREPVRQRPRQPAHEWGGGLPSGSSGPGPAAPKRTSDRGGGTPATRTPRRPPTGAAPCHHRSAAAAHRSRATEAARQPPRRTGRRVGHSRTQWKTRLTWEEVFTVHLGLIGERRLNACAVQPRPPPEYPRQASSPTASGTTRRHLHVPGNRLANPRASSARWRPRIVCPSQTAESVTRPDVSAAPMRSR